MHCVIASSNRSCMSLHQNVACARSKFVSCAHARNSNITTKNSHCKLQAVNYNFSLRRVMAAVKINTDVIAVEGGHLKPGQVLLIKDYTRQDGLTFFSCTRGSDVYSRRLAAFLGKDFRMMEHLIALRNQAFDTATSNINAEDDPMASMGDVASAPACGPPSKRRRASFGELSQTTLALTVLDADEQEHKVIVLPHWYRRATLAMELTTANMDLLLKLPFDHGQADQDEQWRPNLDGTQHVKWQVSRQCCTVRYFANGRWKVKSGRPALPWADLNEDDKQRMFEEVAMNLESFYGTNHTPKQGENVELDDEDADAQAAGAEDHAAGGAAAADDDAEERDTSSEHAR